MHTLNPSSGRQRRWGLYEFKVSLIYIETDRWGWVGVLSMGKGEEEAQG